MRALLAFLLLHANELVSSDRLIDEVWGPEPPKTAGASLQNYISRLRKAIGADRIVSQPPGYVLRVDPELFDLARFERLTAEARGARPRERAEKLRAALELWRGPALEDLAFEPFVRDEIGRLEEARLAALEERINAELALGSDGDLVGELEQLVEEHPLRERFRGQLIHALYRAGRQADALTVYQEARRVLMDELGLEPSEELRALQQAILQQDPALGAGGEVVAERPPDRRTVTVVFCDLVDSTKLARRLDPEVYRSLISRYFDAVREPIERHGGTLEKFIGDAVMAVFGVPELHEDDALRAVRAAVEARDAVRELDLPVRIGVNSGEVHVLSEAGQDLHLSGAALSVASHLEQHASPDEILVGEETVSLVRDAVEVTPVEAGWRLDQIKSGAPAYARRLDAPLVGREQELQRLREAYRSAHDDRHCRVVTVVGEAGIGKTRLIRELLAQLGDEARVLVGRCVSYGEGATYLPIAEIVAQAAPEGSAAGIAYVLGEVEDAEQIARRIAELTGIAEAPSAPGEAFWAVRRFLEAYSAEGPVVVALDDIHWAEPTLLDLVEYLGEWGEGHLLVVCAARRELLEARPGWGGPNSTGFVVELEPLGAADVSSLVSGLSAEPLDPAVEERIVEHAGGNPLFAEQLVALAAEAPDLALDDPPPTVEALIASRLDRLDSGELAVVRRASVIGRRFSREELEDVTPAEEKEQARRHLADLTQRALVHPAEDIFRFHHVLVRDVAYRGIPKVERADLHELAARGLARRDGADEVVGYHFEQAFGYLKELGRTDGRALELAANGGERLGRAGIRAWKRADAPAAVNLLGRATTLLPETEPTRGELICELGAVLRVAGQGDEATRALDEAIETSARTNDRRIELRARIELLHHRTHHGTSKESAAELLDLVSSAIPVFESMGDDRALGRAWLLSGFVQGHYQLQYGALEHAAEVAANHYRIAGWSPAMSLEALMAALYYGPRPVGEAVMRSEDLLRQHVGDRASEANVLQWMGGLVAMRGQFDHARDHIGRAKARYQELGLELVASDGCAMVLAEVELLAGRAQLAEQKLRAACDACIRLSEFALLASRAAQLADVLYSAGRYEEAQTWADLSHTRADNDDLHAQASWSSIASRLAGRRGDTGLALRLIEEAAEIVNQGDGLNQQAKIQLDVADVCHLAGRDEEARRATKRAAELYEAKENEVATLSTRALLASSAYV